MAARSEKSKRWNRALYSDIRWRKHGVDRAISSLGHVVVFVLGKDRRDHFIKTMKASYKAARKAETRLSRRERLALNAEDL